MSIQLMRWELQHSSLIFIFWPQYKKFTSVPFQFPSLGIAFTVKDRLTSPTGL